MSITLTRKALDGRHRLGRPGLIPVTALVSVARRGFFASWFRPARHRRPIVAAPGRRPAGRPVAAAV